jgi:LuxR family maltose regulon positive regulatory protein
VLALASDDLEDARRWTEQVDDPFWSAISVARIHLATGDDTAACVALDDVVPRCVRHEVVLALLRARAVDDREEATKYASRAVEMASAVGLLQTVASEGVLKPSSSSNGRRGVPRRSGSTASGGALW